MIIPSEIRNIIFLTRRLCLSPPERKSAADKIISSKQRSEEKFEGEKHHFAFSINRRKTPNDNFWFLQRLSHVSVLRQFVFFSRLCLQSFFAATENLM